MKRRLLTALLLWPLGAHAQEATNATTTFTGQGVNMVMPLNINLLPAGTIQISEGNYYIANYQNTGVNIYIQSQTPLRIATVEEMARYQAEWTRIITRPGTTTTAPAKMPLTQAADVVKNLATALSEGQPAGIKTPAPVTSRTPAPAASAPAAQNQPKETLPVPRVTTPAPKAKVAPPAPKAAPPTSTPKQTGTMASKLNLTTTPKTPVQTLPTFPKASEIFGVPATLQPVIKTQAPTRAPGASPVATTRMLSPYTRPPVIPPVPVARATPALPTPQPSGLTTSQPLPSDLQVKFNGVGTSTTYSIMNTGNKVWSIDPRTLKVMQKGAIVRSLITLRESKGKSGGTIAPSSAVIGTIKAETTADAPITVQWQIKNAAGKAYLLTYSWSPSNR